MSGRHRSNRVTRRQVWRARQELQHVLFNSAHALRGRVGRAMGVLDDIHMEMRKADIFAAGAKAKRIKHPVRFGGHDLGSSELCVYYDGHASTHPKFENPYRSRGASNSFGVPLSHQPTTSTGGRPIS